VTVKQFH